MPIPAFSDIGKAANDLINKDFYHTAQATLEVKLKTPTGSNVTVKGKQGFDSVTTGSVEGKHTLKPNGTPKSRPVSFKQAPPQRFVTLLHMARKLPVDLPGELWLFCLGLPNGQMDRNEVRLIYHQTGVTVTQAWTTGAMLDSKIEFVDTLAPGVKIDLQNIFFPNKENSAAQKLNFAFKNPNVHSRAFLNHSFMNNNINAVVDITAGHEGFLVGAEAGYDVQKAAIKGYSLALGYQTPTYTASVAGTQNLSIIAASFYQRVNSSVEVGAKAGYDVQGAKASGLELATKYKLDPLSFAKAKINDRGIAALAYSTKLNAGTTIGLGLSLDTAKLNEAGHKIGTSLTFEG
ncbi:Mitochondrial porin [Vermiconidia calcicola]|uniref:Mitochondrial porin n=1 Tax=Vermiconidia calcicola TaxID=1690605 RepID=A0ACC3NW03_9PEZI|nr:Mitochondrial porin [Vermiconidia calcicola]